MCTRTFTCRDCGVEHENHGRRGPIPLRCEGCKKSSRAVRGKEWTATVTCRGCRVSFVASGSRGRIPLYCSSRCRSKRPKPLKQMRCDSCNAIFSGHKGRKWCDQCGPRLRSAAKFPCRECGSLFKKRSGGGKDALKYCSRRCSGLARGKQYDSERQLRKAAGPADNGRDQFFKLLRRAVGVFSGMYKSITKNDCTSKTNCTTCGCVIVCRPQHARGNRYCCRACNPKEKGTQNHAVRAKRRGLPRVYSITLRAVCDRDGNMCQLCGRQTLKMHVDGNGASPSIDHVVPLGHPGNHVHGHVWNNVQLACRECNEKKNARLEHDSLLFATNPRECVAAIRQRQGRMYARRGGSKKQKDMFG